MKQGVHRFYVIISVVSALAVAGISLFLLYSYRAVATTVKDQFVDQQAIVGRQTVLGIEEDIKRLVRELELLSRDPAIQRIDPVAARRVMEQTFAYVKGLFVNDISRTDADGVVRIPLNSPNLVGQSFAERQYFKRVRHLRQSAPVFEFITFRGTKRGQKGIILAMPVFLPDGSFAGPVLFVVDVGDLLKGFLPVRTGDRRSWVIDADGVLLYHPDHPPGTLIHALPGLDPAFVEFLRDARAGAEQRAEYRTEFGRRVLATSTPIRIAGQTWSMVTETREDAIENILVRYNAEHLFANFVAVVMIIGGAFGITSLAHRWNLQLTEEIAERKRAEEELRFREESYRTLVENSPS